MYKAFFTSKIKKDIKLLNKRGYKIDKFSNVVEMLLSGQILPEKYKDHALSGNYSGYRECHIEPDWLLIYQIKENELILILTRTGTHSDLF